MKLKNKKTGEIVEVESLYLTQTQELYLNYINEENKQKVYTTDKIASFNLDWEDYEEAKGNWTIDPMNENYIDDGRYTAPDELERYEELGLKFNTEEEAEKAVEKLKALERLRKNGFKFDGFRQDYTRWSSGQDAFRDGKRYIHFNKADDDDWLKENWKDLKLVFKEEE